MAENITTNAIAPGSIPFLNSISGAGTLYTATARRRLHIVSMVISTLGGTAAGVATISIVPENAAGGGTFQCSASGSSGQGNSATLDPIDLPTVTSVTTTLTGTGTSATFTLYGWEETTEK